MGIKYNFTLNAISVIITIMRFRFRCIHTSTKKYKIMKFNAVCSENTRKYIKCTIRLLSSVFFHFVSITLYLNFDFENQNRRTTIPTHIIKCSGLSLKQVMVECKLKLENGWR